MWATKLKTKQTQEAQTVNSEIMETSDTRVDKII